MTTLELDPNLLATLQTLESHAVEYVLVGEVAEAIHDGGGSISGVAIVPGSYGRNVDRLASALDELDSHTSNGAPIDFHVCDLLAAAPCTLRTRYADIELDFTPSGTSGYRDLFEDAARHSLAPGISPHVASPSDLDRMAAAARDEYGSVPPAVPPAALPPTPSHSSSYWEGDESIPPAVAPERLPPEPVGWPAEIRASRATRT